MNQEGAPNYFPNSFSGPRDGKQFLESKFTVTPDVGRFNSADEDNFTQCGIFFRDVLNKDEKFRLVDNIASHVINAQEFLQVSTVYQVKTVLWNGQILILVKCNLNLFLEAKKVAQIC